MYVTLRYDFELGFQGQISKTPYIVIPTVILTLDRPWPWTRIVKLKLSKSYISATEGPLDIERKAYEYDQEPITEEHPSTIGVCDNCPPLKEVINSP